MDFCSDRVVCFSVCSSESSVPTVEWFCWASNVRWGMNWRLLHGGKIGVCGIAFKTA